MQDNNSIRKKDIDTPTGSWVMMIIAFMLSIADMWLLYKALASLLGIANAVAMALAFILSIVASVFAMEWGRNAGHYPARHSINQKTVLFFIIWLLLGIIFSAIRITVLIESIGDPDVDIVGQILTIVLLAILFVGGGLTIKHCAQRIWDADTYGCRQAKKQFELAHNEAAEEIAEIKKIIGQLSSYKMNYSTLDRQKRKIETAISKTEDATMADIMGKVLAENPGTNPRTAREIKAQVLKRRHDKDNISSTHNV